MIGRELRPGLWRWTAFHPQWKKEVACHAVKTSDGLVLIDPLIGDEEVEQPAHILITVHWHVRGTKGLSDYFSQPRHRVRLPPVRAVAPAGAP